MALIGYFVPIVAVGIYALGLRRFLKDKLQPFAYKLLIALTLFELILVLSHLLVWWTPELENLRGIFTISAERTLGAIASATQLFLVGLLAFFIARYGQFKYHWQEEYWYFLASLFVFLSVDEYYRIHDYVNEAAFAVAAAAGMGILTFALWIGFRQDLWLVALFVAGFLIAGLGITLDVFLPNTPEAGALEEFLEMSGITLILSGFLSYAQSRFAPAIWNKTKKGLLFAAILCSIWLFVSFWTIVLIPAGALIIALLTGGAYLAMLLRLTGKWMPALPRFVMVILTVLALILILLHLLAAINGEPALFDPDNQDGIAPIITTILLLIVGLIALLIGRCAIAFERRYWQLVTLTFGLLAVMEFFQMRDQVRTIIHISIASAVVGIILAGFRLNYIKGRQPYRLLVFGAGMFILFCVLNTVLPASLERFALTSFLILNSISLILVSFLVFLERRKSQT